MWLLEDEEIREAMIEAIDTGQEYTLLNGRPEPLPERIVAKAQAKKIVEGIEWLRQFFQHNHWYQVANEQWDAVYREHYKDCPLCVLESFIKEIEG